MKFNSHGFTLIEMLIVVVVMAVLLSLATLQFNSWQVKTNINTQTRELLADISDARLGAIQTKGSRTVILSPTSAMFRSYTTNELVTLANGKLLFTKKFKNSIVYSGNIGFNSNGLTNDFDNTFNSNQTLVIQPSGTAAAIDCLVISMTKINVGKYNNGSCAFQ
jgi:prepilin-type N-terminal cleavage/methylation domain-containing protein